jgi:hypothetical protein
MEGNEMKEFYAVIRWSWEDVQNVRPDWDETRCREWWAKNEKWFADALTEHGNEMLSNLLD